MDDLSFPVLVGAALPAGVKFVLNQFGAFIERRRVRRESRQSLPEGAALELPDSITAHGPLQLDDVAIDAHSQEIEMLHALLTLSYERDNLDGAEPQLRIIMARAKSVLEAVYHQQISFVSDEKDATLVAKQQLDDAHGTVTGLDIGAVDKGGHAEVDQKITTLHETGSATAARVERLG